MYAGYFQVLFSTVIVLKDGEAVYDRFDARLLPAEASIPPPPAPNGLSLTTAKLPLASRGAERVDML